MYDQWAVIVQSHQQFQNSVTCKRVPIGVTKWAKYVFVLFVLQFSHCFVSNWLLSRERTPDRKEWNYCDKNAKLSIGLSLSGNDSSPFLSNEIQYWYYFNLEKQLSLGQSMIANKAFQGEISCVLRTNSNWLGHLNFSEFRIFKIRCEKLWILDGSFKGVFIS